MASKNPALALKIKDEINDNMSIKYPVFFLVLKKYNADKIKLEYKNILENLKYKGNESSLENLLNESSPALCKKFEEINPF
jgi:hypothetical protein